MRLLVLCLALGLALGAAFALPVGAQDDEDNSALLNFLVIKDYNGKPVRNASVVMHPVNKKGQQERGGLELKTDADGKASFDGVPYGKLRVQVLAQGFQTFGADYDIDKPTMEITVKMKRPGEQYSIYENQQNEKKDDSKPPPASNELKVRSRSKSECRNKTPWKRELFILHFEF